MGRHAAASSLVVALLATPLLTGCGPRPARVQALLVAEDGRTGVPCFVQVVPEQVRPHPLRLDAARTGGAYTYAGEAAMGWREAEAFTLAVRCQGYEPLSSRRFSWRPWRRSVDLGTLTLRRPGAAGSR
jgi:hypothetical protein